MTCPHFGPCGGCSSQDKAYTDQLLAKQKLVEKNLAGLAVDEFRAIMASPDVFYYRNKMEFSFGDERDIEILNHQPVSEGGKSVHLGLHPKGRFALVTPTPECLLESLESQQVMNVVTSWATKHQIPVYVRKSGEGDLRHLVIREGKNTGERLVNLVAKSSTRHLDKLAAGLQESGIPIQTFLWTAHDGKSDAVMGEVGRVFWGEGFIREKMEGKSFQVAPSSFFQTNTRAFEACLRILKSWVSEDSLAGQSRLFDLYCGCGSIGLSLAEHFKEVVGIEINGAAVQDAVKNAESNDITNVRFLVGRVEALLPTIPFAPGEQAAVVVDPPRAGLMPKVVETLLAWGAPHLYYISCNPESLGRDLRVLGARYRIVSVQPMDFFPHTQHIETAVRLRLHS